MSDAATFRRPESILVVVHNDHGEVLLLKRQQPFEFWQSITGSLQPGESPAAGAARELQEETGIVGSPVATGVSRQFAIDPRWRNRFAPGVLDNVEYEFRLRVEGQPAIQLDPLEHSAFAWVSVSDAIERAWSWTNRDALENLPISLS